jgi:hypothetical protein
MQRDLAEVLASQSKMLASRGESSDTADERMRRLYVGHLAQSRRLLSDRPCFESIEIHYREALADPEETARKIERFLGKDLNTRAMAAAVNPDLYRNRAPPTP